MDEATGHAVTQNARVAALVRKLGFREGPTTPGEPWMTDRGWTVTTWTLTRAAWGDPLQ